MNRPLTQLLLCCLLWLAVACAYADAPIAYVNNLDEAFDLNPFVETIEDPHHQFTLEDIQAGKYDHLWVRNQERYFIGRNVNSKYWFRVAMHWQLAEQTEAYIYIDNQPSLINRLGVIIPSEPSKPARIYESGFFESHANHDAISQRYVFKMQWRSNETVTIYGWLHNGEAALPVSFPLYLLSLHTLSEKQQQINGIQIAFYSVMSALFFYNLCLFISLRQTVYGLYIAFLALAIFQCAYLDGNTWRWLWPEAPLTNFKMGNTSGNLLGILYLAFVIKALNSFTLWPWLAKIYHISVVTGLLVCGYCMFSNDTAISSFVSQTYPGIVIPVAFLIIMTSMVNRVPTAGYLFIAEIFTLCGGISFMLMVQGILPINIFTAWSIHGGILGEALLLSLALAARTRIAQQSAIKHLEDYEALYQNSIEGRFLYAPKGKANKCNHAMAILCGYESVEAFIAADRIMNLSDEETNNRLRNVLHTHGYVTDFEAQITNQKTHQAVWVSLNMQLKKDDKDQSAWVEGSVVDISERKLKEQAEFDRATADFKNAAKSQFFASMSHELRTPLTAILGYSETAMPQDVSFQQKQIALEIIHRSGNHLLQIINDILDISKVEAQKLETEQIQVYLLALLDEVQETLMVLAGQKNLSFSLNYHYPLPKIFTNDPTRIKQVLLNLCGNAIKFTETGGVSVDVHCDKEQQLLSFVIKDSGIGLKPEQVENLFEAFTQADASTTRNYGGTGLGLHLSKQLAQRLGGDIQVTSIYGAGCTFTFTVATDDLNNAEWLDDSLHSIKKMHCKPIERNAISAVMTESLTGCNPGAETHLSVQTDNLAASQQISAALRVLVAEDNPDNQGLIKIHLKRAGAETIIANDGVEALTKAMTEDFDLVLMDMHMPTMDGLTAVRYLRGKGFHKPIYALTANETAEAIQECKDAGCDGHLSKPLNTVKLTELIDRITKHNGS